MIGFRIEPPRQKISLQRHHFGVVIVLSAVTLATFLGSGWGTAGQADSETSSATTETQTEGAPAGVEEPANGTVPPAADATFLPDESGRLPDENGNDSPPAEPAAKSEVDASAPESASPMVEAEPASPTEHPAATVPETGLTAKLNKRGSITLRDTTLNEALFAIRQQWGIDLVFGSELQTEVNAVFSDAPLYQILDTLLNTQGYGYRTVGQTLVVAKLEEIGTNNPLFETITVPVRYGNASDIEIVIKDLKLSSPNGRVAAVPSAKSLLVVDMPDRVAKIRRRIEELDAAMGKVKQEGDGRRPTTPVADGDGSQKTTPVGPQPPAPPNGMAPELVDRGNLLEPAYFDVTNVPADKLQEPLQYLLSTSGQISVIEKENRIMVLDTPEHLARVAKALQHLDVARPQVRIWAMIYDVDLQDLDRLGINWNSRVKGVNVNPLGTPNQALDLTGMTNSNPVASALNGGMRLTSLNTNFDVTAVVNALSTSEVSRLLANPNVIVVDHEKATISIVTEIPYQQLTQGIQGGSIGTTAFREAGVKLDVTPRIAEDGTIEMIVNPVFSVLSGYTPETNQPIINKREATTTVRVPSGQTFVIGGLRQREITNNISGIPVLKDLPLGIGLLFRSRQSRSRESELLVFLTPEIIGLDPCLHPREAASFDYSRSMLATIPVPIGPDGLPRAPVATGPMHEYAPLPPGRPDLYLDPHAPVNPPVVAPEPAAPEPTPPIPATDLNPSIEPRPAPQSSESPAPVAPPVTTPRPAVAAPVIPAPEAVPGPAAPTLQPPSPAEEEPGDPPPVQVDDTAHLGRPRGPVRSGTPGGTQSIRRFPPIAQRSGDATPPSAASSTPVRPVGYESKRTPTPTPNVKRFPVNEGATKPSVPTAKPPSGTTGK